MAEEHGVPSPLQFRGPKVIKHLDIEVNEHGTRNEFLNQMSALGLFLVGWGSVYAFTAYTPGSPADIAGTIALFAWMLAAVEAIAEHSHTGHGKRRKESVEKLIKDAIVQFEKTP